MAFVPSGQYLTPGYVPAMLPMAQMQQPMQLFPGMMAAPQPTPQFANAPLQQPQYPWQLGVTPDTRSDSGEDDDEPDSIFGDEDEDEDEEWDREAIKRHTFLQAGSQAHLPSRGRSMLFSGERGGRSRSAGRECQYCSL